MCVTYLVSTGSHDPLPEVARLVQRLLAILRREEVRVELVALARISMGHGGARIIVGPEGRRRAPVGVELLEACAARGSRTARCGIGRAREVPTGQLRRAARGVNFVS